MSRGPAHAEREMAGAAGHASCCRSCESGAACGRAGHPVALTGGRPLDAPELAPMGAAFGRDFRGVRIHADSGADGLARSVGARALTIGANVAFARGQYLPATSRGIGLLAHELSHVVQQSRGGTAPAETPDLERAADEAAASVQAGLPAKVRGSAAVGIARQQGGGPPGAPLAWGELFSILQRQAAWEFNPGGAPLEDPKSEGRGVGPAAGGRRAGHSVFAVIQITDADGRQVALAYGEHIRYGGAHAEEGAVRSVGKPSPTWRGGVMEVVVTQTPCGPDRADCGTRLRDFARENGLGLKVVVPRQEYANDPARSKKPRGSLQGSQRKGLTAVQMAELPELGLPTPPRAGPGGGGGGPAPPSVPPVKSGPATPHEQPLGSGPAAARPALTGKGEAPAPQAGTAGAPAKGVGPTVSGEGAAAHEGRGAQPKALDDAETPHGRGRLVSIRPGKPISIVPRSGWHLVEPTMRGIGVGLSFLDLVGMLDQFLDDLLAAKTHEPRRDAAIEDARAAIRARNPAAPDLVGPELSATAQRNRSALAFFGGSGDAMKALIEWGADRRGEGPPTWEWHLSGLHVHSTSLGRAQEILAARMEALGALYANVRQREQVSREIARELGEWVDDPVVRAIPVSTARMQVYDLYRQWDSAGRDLGGVLSLVRGTITDYDRAWSGFESQRREADRLVRYWLPAYERISGRPFAPLDDRLRRWIRHTYLGIPDEGPGAASGGGRVEP